MPRREICFVRGEPGAEQLVCVDCGHVLEPAQGAWVAKHPGRPRRGYHVGKFASVVLSEREREMGARSKPAALLAEWRETKFPAEFFNSELGLPYWRPKADLPSRTAGSVGGYPITADRPGKGCVMGVDQGNGLHVVVKEPMKTGTGLHRSSASRTHEPITPSPISTIS